MGHEGEGWGMKEGEGMNVKQNSLGAKNEGCCSKEYG